MSYLSRGGDHLHGAPRHSFGKPVPGGRGKRPPVPAGKAPPPPVTKAPPPPPGASPAPPRGKPPPPPPGKSPPPPSNSYHPPFSPKPAPPRPSAPAPKPPLSPAPARPRGPAPKPLSGTPSPIHRRLSSNLPASSSPRLPPRQGKAKTRPNSPRTSLPVSAKQRAPSPPLTSKSQVYSSSAPNLKSHARPLTSSGADLPRSPRSPPPKPPGPPPVQNSNFSAGGPPGSCLRPAHSSPALSAAPDNKSQNMRQQVLQEIISTERDYINDIDTTISVRTLIFDFPPVIS